METSHDPIQSIQKHNSFAILSFVLGLATAIFPVIAFYYLIAEQGGAGYFQSLLCGFPFPLISILLGIVALVQIRRLNLPGSASPAAQAAWMAIVGISYGILVFGIECVMLAALILPFILGVAQ
jgi:hypothetical protein